MRPIWTKAYLVTLLIRPPRSRSRSGRPVTLYSRVNRVCDVSSHSQFKLNCLIGNIKLGSASERPQLSNHRLCGGNH